MTTAKMRAGWFDFIPCGILAPEGVHDVRCAGQVQIQHVIEVLDRAVCGLQLEFKTSIVNILLSFITATLIGSVTYFIKMSTSWLSNIIEINPVLNTALIFFITVVLLLIYTSSKCPKNLPPGPKGLPYFGYLPFLGSKPHITLIKLRKKYGDIFNGERVIVLSSFKLIKEALLKPVFDERPAPIRALATWAPEGGVFSGYGDSRIELRRFVLTTLRNYGVGKTSLEPQIQDEINCMIEEITKLDGKPTDFRNLLSMSVTNIIVSILYGKRMKYYAPDFEELINLSKTYLNSVGLDQWSDHLPQYFGSMLYEKLLEKIKNYDKSKVSNSSENFIDSWRAEAEKSKTNLAIYNEEKLAQVLCELFIAGSDTTSVTLEWALLYLVKHPEIQKKYKWKLMM
uniref:Cytochrome P450 n=1 Tax=Strigamia maritima TaxID=126957 RepID=T1JBP6_STRMM